jgi:hypothetical protein
MCLEVAKDMSNMKVGLLAQTTNAVLVTFLGGLLAGLGCLWADRQANWFSSASIPNVTTPVFAGSEQAMMHGANEKAERALTNSQQALRENKRLRAEITKRIDHILAENEVERRKVVLVAIFWAICSGVLVSVAGYLLLQASFKKDLQVLHDKDEAWDLDRLADDGCPNFPEDPQPASDHAPPIGPLADGNGRPAS